MKRLLIILLAFLFVLGMIHSAGAAEKYPVKPINFIVPLEAGSDGDLAARPLVERASPVMGQPVVVVNKPGAGSTIGYYQIRDAKPDGYTIGMGTVTLVTSKLQGLFPYDYNDFSLMATFYRWPPIVVASAKSKRGFKTMADVVAYAKAHPGEVSIATAGVGQSQWIAAMAFMESTGLKFNAIPQEGAGGVTVAQVAGGHTDLAVLGVGSAKSQIEAGNLIPIAVLGTKRLPGNLNNVPTCKETGYDVSWESFGVVIGPPKIPKDVFDKLAQAFEVAAKNPGYVKYLESRSANEFYLPPDQIGKFCDGYTTLVRNIMGKAGILKGK
ncbi:MAG: tripartite tricarboxylate transporter substrate binding protein [Deltaproteobacteria bacterium]